MRQEAEQDGTLWREVLGDLLDTLELQERQLKRVSRCLDARLEKLPGARFGTARPCVPFMNEYACTEATQ